MIKIFRCECRRLLCNKFFIGLLAVLLFYAGQVFYAVALPGVAHTAPFSPWSFGAYLGRLLPLVWVGALFFLTFFTSARERQSIWPVTCPPIPRQAKLFAVKNSGWALSHPSVIELPMSTTAGGVVSCALASA